jgi:hypothetical protein
VEIKLFIINNLGIAVRRLRMGVGSDLGLKMDKAFKNGRLGIALRGLRMGFLFNFP